MHQAAWNRDGADPAGPADGRPAPELRGGTDSYLPRGAPGLGRFLRELERGPCRGTPRVVLTARPGAPVPTRRYRQGRLNDLLPRTAG